MLSTTRKNEENRTVERKRKGSPDSEHSTNRSMEPEHGRRNTEFKVSVVEK